MAFENVSNPMPTEQTLRAGPVNAIFRPAAILPPRRRVDAMLRPARACAAWIVLLSTLAARCEGAQETEPAKISPAPKSPAAAALNPFDQAAQTAFAGRYVGRLDGVVVQIRLKPAGGAWTGSFVKGNRYTLQATSGPGALEGFCGNGQESFPFSVTSDGERLRFTAGTISTLLARQKFPKLGDLYETKRVRLQFENRAGQTNGTIRFNGRDYRFTAAEVAGDLEGTFSDSSGSFPFSLAQEGRTMIFRSGAFSEAFPFQNSLGMVFTEVPGTDVLFCIWETRVRDYAAYAGAHTGVDGSWRNPGFTQGDDHPVVNVSWDEAKWFCAWLTGKERTAGRLQPDQEYRLPTDAEWSVAVGLPKESGSTPKDKSEKIKDVYPWGTAWPPPSGAGNYADQSCKQKYPSYGVIEGYADGYADTAPVGSFKPNQFGLYDLGGNVLEWCEDWYDPATKSSRVLRGGSWNIGGPGLLLSSIRPDLTPVNRLSDFGFRVVLMEGGSR